MKTSIETINGKLCTIIRRPFYAEKVRESLAMGVPVVAETEHNEHVIIVAMEERPAGGPIFKFDSRISGPVYETENMMKCLKTILPALPREPKAEDAALLYRYASEGIYLCGTSINEDEEILWGSKTTAIGLLTWIGFMDIQITHAFDATGNRVEVAIYG